MLTDPLFWKLASCFALNAVFFWLAGYCYGSDVRVELEGDHDL